MARIPAGRYEPFYPSEPGERVTVAPFRLDVLPVTNARYLAFVRGHPRWRRGSVPRLFADPGYLGRWSSPTSLGSGVLPEAPATQVSWFAAAAYCRARGARLPTEAEWEYVARADERSPDGMTTPANVRRILGWYGSPRRGRTPVGEGAPNIYGVHDLHGLIWEWVEDFNATMVSGDNRQDRDQQRNRFCGGASIGSADIGNYAAFMRFAFRSSLEASYTVPNLGFRCAAD